MSNEEPDRLPSVPRGIFARSHMRRISAMRKTKGRKPDPTYEEVLTMAKTNPSMRKKIRELHKEFGTTPEANPRGAATRDSRSEGR